MPHEVITLDGRGDYVAWRDVYVNEQGKLEANIDGEKHHVIKKGGRYPRFFINWPEDKPYPVDVPEWRSKRAYKS